MTPESQRIAIAEACPTLFVHVPSPYGPGGLHWREGKDDNGKTVSPGAHVDPLNDLNAMHEAEKVLSSKQQEIYAAILADCVCHDEDVVINTVDDLLPEDYFRCAHATAAQRSQAFLMTLGLWKD